MTLLQNSKLVLLQQTPMGLTNKMKKVQYIAPDVDNNPVYYTFTIDEAVAIQRNFAIEAHNYSYASDEEALIDFVTINWAHYIEEK